MISLQKILLSGCIISLITCKAQEYPLNTDFRNIPNYSYLKDMNNELDAYTGTYNTFFNGNIITLFITKEAHKLIEYTNQKFYRDVVSIKFIVKDSNGIVLQNSQSEDSQKNAIYSMRINPYYNILTINYKGTNCGVGNGFIYLKKLNSTQISWEYIPDSTIIDSSKCPPGTDTTIYLPETKDLIFTKQ